MSGSSVSVLELPVKFGPVKKVTPAVTGPASCAAAAAGSSSAAAAATTAVATRRRSPKRIIETPPVRRALGTPSLHLFVIPATAPRRGLTLSIGLLRRLVSGQIEFWARRLASRYGQVRDRKSGV